MRAMLWSLVVGPALAAEDPRGLPAAWRMVGEGIAGASLADVDGDGRLDVVVAAPTVDAPGRTWILRQGAGGGGVIDHEVGSDLAVPAAWSAGLGVWGDLNGDGAADQLTWTGDAPARDRALQVRPGGPSGPAAEARAVTVDDATVPFRFGAKVPIAAADINLDGYTDVLMRAFLRDATDGDQHLAMHLGSAAGLTTGAVWRRELGGEGFVAGRPDIVGDVDRDGFRDIVYVELYTFDGLTSGSITLTRGDEDGFRDATWASILLPGGVTRLDGYRVMDAGDLSGDGYEDVLVHVTPDDPTAPSTLSLLEGDPNYGFKISAPVELWSLVVASPWLLGLGDLDGDGVRDLAMGDPTAREVLFQRDALGYVSTPTPWFYVGAAGELAFGRGGAVGDVSADGLDDLVVVDDGGVSLLLGFQDADLDQSDDGDDCDPGDAEVHPGAEEVWYDGTDQDCDGNDDDQDGDGYGRDVDCHDEDPLLGPETAEVWYDGVDQDCDGNDDDQDGDGASLNDDCDDEDAARFPGAVDAADNGVDEDCDGADATADEPAADACGCAHGVGGGWWAAVALLAARRRRR